MSASLAVCTKEDQRVVVRFCMGLKFTHVHELNMGTLTKFYEWIEVCKSGRIKVTDSECFGCLSTIASDDRKKPES